jgi:hypothetical protein
MSVSSPGIEPGLRPSQGRVRIRHTPRTKLIQSVETAAGADRARTESPQSESCRDRCASPRNRTPSCSFEHCRAHPAHPQGALLSQYPDLDSNQGPDLRRVRCKSATPLGFNFTQEPTTGFAPASTCLQDRRLSVSSHVGKHECEESNPVGRFWRPLALPGAHSCKAHGNKPRGRINFVTSPAGRSNTSR